jgi:hypothetical protein
MTLRGPAIANDFKQLVADYITRRYGELGRDAAYWRLNANRNNEHAA